MAIGTGPWRAGAQCVQPDDLRRLATSIRQTLDCGRIRLTSQRVCAPTAPPACAGSLVDDLVALAGLPLTVGAADRSALAPALRCQRLLVHATARYAEKRVDEAVRGDPATAGDLAAARRLRALARRCATAVHLTSDGVPLPRLGPACASVMPPPDGIVPAAEMKTCLERALRARLERTLRPTIRPNIILVLTDDQPPSTMDTLATVQTWIAADGTDFVQASPQAPLCAPSRASILTGQYVRRHGVAGNLPPIDLSAFDDSSTVATWLHDTGYRTGFIGKYLNGYEHVAPYVPPGWDTWQAFVTPAYYQYQLVDEHGGLTSFGTHPAHYSTDVLASKAVQFIEQDDDRPFLLVFAPYGPHEPTVPASRHIGAYAGTPPWRPASFDEADVSDKASWVRALPRLTANDVAGIDTQHEAILESLLSVDEAVAALLAALATTGQEDNTFIAFTTDNGLEQGEHRWNAKGDPYEGSTHVPLVVRYPRMGAVPATVSSFVSLIDLAPTWAELAGTTPGLPVDGASLLGLLDGTGISTWRQDLLVESWPIQPAPRHMVVRWDRWKYVEYATAPFAAGEVELYDLVADPDELTSVHADPANATVRTYLAARLRALNQDWTQPVP
jgi:arylsulfatase A-like enzyme